MGQIGNIMYQISKWFFIIFLPVILLFFVPLSFVYKISIPEPINNIIVILGGIFVFLSPMFLILLLLTKPVADKNLTAEDQKKIDRRRRLWKGLLAIVAFLIFIPLAVTAILFIGG
jgi:hypothetical protein